MHNQSGLEGEGELQTPLRLRIEKLYCRCAAPGIMSSVLCRLRPQDLCETFVT